MPPTLMQKHKYIWPEGSKLTSREKYITENFTAIDIICEVLKNKLEINCLMNKIFEGNAKLNE